MRKISKNKIKSKWVNFDKDPDVKFKLRPVPINNILLGVALEGDRKKIIWDKFNYALEEWEGMTDENDKPLPCTEENKKFVFDWDEEILLFIGNKLGAAPDDINPIEKKT